MSQYDIKEMTISFVVKTCQQIYVRCSHKWQTELYSKTRHGYGKMNPSAWRHSFLSRPHSVVERRRCNGTTREHLSSWSFRPSTAKDPRGSHHSPRSSSPCSHPLHKAFVLLAALHLCAGKVFLIAKLEELCSCLG